jgi:pimeloyl-ACP methyl ester carboxylesterase
LAIWNAQAAAFDGKVRSIFVDLPGSGQSDKPNVSYSMEYFAGALDAVVRDAGVDRVVLVGHSMGTPVIRQFYRTNPSKVAGRVVASSMRGMMDPSVRCCSNS